MLTTEIISEFDQFLLKEGYSPRTVKAYNYCVSRFAGKLDILNCTYQEIAAAVSSAEFSNRYKHAILSGLKQFFRFLVEKGERTDHPCVRLHIRNNYETRFIESDFLTSAELRLLQTRPQRYSLLEKRDNALLSLLTLQGLTTDELVALNVGDLDFNRNIVRIHASRRQAGRKLGLLDHQVEQLRSYLQNTRPLLERDYTKTLLLGKNGTPLTADSIHYLVSTLAHLVPDKKLTPSLIRQSVIVWWLNELKIPAEQVQLLCGHRWLSTTLKYKFIPIQQEVKMVNKWL